MGGMKRSLQTADFGQVLGVRPVPFFTDRKWRRNGFRSPLKRCAERSVIASAGSTTEEPRMKHFARIACLAAAVAFVAAPLMAGDDVILSGIDLWNTPADGSTFADFTREPIPADFFCAGSRAFTGKIEFTGSPIETFPKGIYGNADTIIHRLQDAYFNEEGVAVTQIQVAALSFRSVAAFVNECGSFRVRVRLDGEQPITQMRIVKDNPLGGHFESPLDINVMVEFTLAAPSSRLTKRASKGYTVEIPQQIRFAPNRGAVWSTRVGKGGVKVDRPALVDTDNDGAVDRELPGTSNFAAGWMASTNGSVTRALAVSCHCNPLLAFDEVQTLIAATTTCKHLHCPVPITPVLE